MVLESTMIAPSLTVSAAPCVPNRTLSTAWVSETHTQTTSAPVAASAGDPAKRAPSTSLGVRFHTDTSCPAFTRFNAIGRPMIPKPKNATRMLAPEQSIRTDLGNSGQAIAAQSFKFVFWRNDRGQRAGTGRHHY